MFTHYSPKHINRDLRGFHVLVRSVMAIIHRPTFPLPILKVRPILPSMNAQTKLSAKGQVVIPKDVRERLRWDAGMRLEVIENLRSVTLRATDWHNPFPRTTIDDLRAIPPWPGPPKTVEEISRLSREDMLFMIEKQERNARD